MTNPHDLQERLASALSALNCMTDQRDQLAGQLKDTTAQLARACYLKGDALPPKVPEGWQLVPVEPTSEMIKAGVWANHNLDGVGRTYEVMLEAAPKQEGQ